MTFKVLQTQTSKTLGIRAITIEMSHFIKIISLNEIKAELQSFTRKHTSSRYSRTI